MEMMCFKLLMTSAMSLGHYSMRNFMKSNNDLTKVCKFAGESIRGGRGAALLRARDDTTAHTQESEERKRGTEGGWEQVGYGRPKGYGKQRGESADFLSPNCNCTNWRELGFDNVT